MFHNAKKSAAACSARLQIDSERQSTKFSFLISAAALAATLFSIPVHSGSLVSPSVGSVVVRAVVLSSVSLDASMGSSQSITLESSGRRQCVIGCAEGGNPEPISVTASWNLSPSAHNSLELCAYWSNASALSSASGPVSAADTAIATSLAGGFGDGRNALPIRQPLALSDPSGCGIPDGKSAPKRAPGRSLSLWRLPIDERNAITAANPATTKVSLYATSPAAAGNGPYGGTLNFVLLELQ